MRATIPFKRRPGLSGLGMQLEPTGDDFIFGGDSYFASPAKVAAANKLAPTVAANAVNVVQTSAADTKKTVDSVVAFMSWLQGKFPDVYKGVMQSRPDLAIPEFAMAGLAGLRVRQGLAGLAAADDTTPTSSWGQQISDLINKVAAPLLSTYQQKKILDINIKRAEMGLDPIDSTAIAPTVNVGVPPEQFSQIANLGKYMVFGVLGIGALYLLGKKKGR